MNQDNAIVGFVIDGAKNLDFGTFKDFTGKNAAVKERSPTGGSPPSSTSSRARCWTGSSGPDPSAPPPARVTDPTSDPVSSLATRG